VALLEDDLLAYSDLKITTIVHHFIISQQKILFPERDELRRGFKRISFEILEFFDNLIWRITGSSPSSYIVKFIAEELK